MAKYHPAQPFNITGICMMERAEGWHGGGIGNVVDSRHGVGNAGLDRGRVDVVVEDRATRIQTGNRNTVLGVAVERGKAIAITKWAMALGRQRGTRHCWTLGAIQ